MLPSGLTWTAHHGESDPPLGWYSPRFGAKVPSTTLVGTAAWTGTLNLRTTLELPLVPGADQARSAFAVSSGPSDPP